MFFVVGRGRSGTTLLCQLLDRHPAVCVSPEALFIMSLHRRYRSASWDVQAVRRFVRDLWTEERMTRWRLDESRLLARLQELARSGRASFSLVCAEVYAEHARSRGKEDASLFGDKNPHYALFVESLAAIFPRARFLHMVRDHRDNVLSYQRVGFDLSSISGLAYRWREYNRRILAHREELGERYRRVRFEDLVTRQTETLTSVCDFLGIELRPEMTNAPATMPVASLPWHAGLRGPVDAGQADKWVDAMPEPDVRLADLLCRDPADELGYGVRSTGSRGPAGRPLRAIPGLAVAWVVTRLEELLFRLPLGVRWRVIRGYRRLTGNRIG
jgi:LPS sulfotransferase NodH